MRWRPGNMLLICGWRRSDGYRRTFSSLQSGARIILTTAVVSTGCDRPTYWTRTDSTNSYENQEHRTNTIGAAPTPAVSGWTQETSIQMAPLFARDALDVLGWYYWKYEQKIPASYSMCMVSLVQYDRNEAGNFDRTVLLEGHWRRLKSKGRDAISILAAVDKKGGTGVPKFYLRYGIPDRMRQYQRSIEAPECFSCKWGFSSLKSESGTRQVLERDGEVIIMWLLQPNAVPQGTSFDEWPTRNDFRAYVAVEVETK